MKKVGIFLWVLILAASLHAVKTRFFTSLGYGWHNNSDQYAEQVYDNWSTCLVLDAGYWFSEHFAAGIRMGYSTMNGETALLKSETSLRHIPVTAYGKAGGKINEKWLGYISVGIGYMLFREESYMGKVEDAQFGWEVDSGVEFSPATNVYFLAAIRYQSFRKKFPRMSETHQLGGTDIRLGVGIRY